MRVSNQTPWRTDHLKAIAKRVAETELDPATRSRFLLRFRLGRQRPSGSCSGRAPIGGSRIQVNVPPRHVDHVDLAFVIAHEMAHARGVTHSQMRGSPRYRRLEGTRAIYAWAAEMPLERQLVRAKPTTDERRAVKLERARAMLAKWQRRQKSAAGYVKRWSARVRRLEGLERLAASAALAKEVSRG
jgi:hypothetical protein